MKKHSARSSLFLIELMIAILFFSIASAICVRLFVKAHTVSTDTQNLNIAVIKAQNAAECLSLNSSLNHLETVFPEGGLAQPSQFLAGFDSSWQDCPVADAAYILIVDSSAENRTNSFTITISPKNSPAVIYSLEIRQNIPYTLQ